MWLVVSLDSSPSQAGSWVQFQTPFGNLDVELLDHEKPVTVQNFLRYVQEVYPTNHVLMHRCLPGFVLQGGGYFVRDRDSTNDFGGAGRVSRFPVITNEFLVGAKQSNLFGTIAMAKQAGVTNSASSEWFFNLGNNSTNLDVQNGGFTVFGRVMEGTNVLRRFNGLSKFVSETNCEFFGIVDMECFFNDPAVSTFTDTPVTYVGNRLPTYRELQYAVIKPLIRLQIHARLDRSRELVWNSFGTAIHRVEYNDTVLSNNWKLLTQAQGNGDEQRSVDTEAISGPRFYRVRLE